MKRDRLAGSTPSLGTHSDIRWTGRQHGQFFHRVQLNQPQTRGYGRYRMVATPTLILLHKGAVFV
jgi:hypothetical protein